MTSIVLVDDHNVVRQGLRAILEAEVDFSVVGEASNGLDGIRLVDSLHPDILVVDIMMNGINGLEVARRISRSSPKTGIVVLSMYDNEAYVIEALKAGAKAYVLKGATSNELVEAIRAVAAGRRYLSSPISERAIETYMRKAEAPSVDPYDMLTPREREVLFLASQDLSNNEIADQLVISRRTVEVHRHNVMRKLGLRNRIQLLRYAVQRGIIPAEK